MLNKHRQRNLALAVKIGALLTVIAAAFIIQITIITPALDRDKAVLDAGASILYTYRLHTRDDTGEHPASIIRVSKVAETVRDGGSLLGVDDQQYAIKPSQDTAQIAAAHQLVQAAAAAQSSQIQDLLKSFSDANRAVLKRKQMRTNWFWVAVLITSLLLLVLIFHHFFRRLRHADQLWIASLNENKTILDTTKDGLFLIKPTLQVSSVQSSAVQEMFGIKGPIQGDVFEFLKRVVTPEDLSDAKDFIILMLGERGNSALIDDLNPLKEVEITVVNSLGFASQKILKFDFSRNDSNPTVGLLVSVSDITTEVVLRKELIQIGRENEERFHLLMGSMSSDFDKMRVFFHKAHGALGEINDLLRDDKGEHEDNEQKLQDILQTVQSLKSHASVAGASLMETSAHQIEDKIGELLAGNLVDGRQILSLTVQLKRMISDLGYLEQLTTKIGTKGGATPPVTATFGLRSETGEESELHWFTKEVAARQGKLVVLELSGFEHYEISEPVAKELYVICVELVRNSVMHGIEEPKVRRKLGKSSVGEIAISLSDYDDETVQMTVIDDGAGFNFSAIKKAAVQRGLVEPEIVKSMTKGQLIKFIFLSGFSTHENVKADICRGLGLDRIKESLARMDGKIRVRSTRGVSSMISIRIVRVGFSTSSWYGIKSQRWLVE